MFVSMNELFRILPRLLVKQVKEFDQFLVKSDFLIRYCPSLEVPHYQIHPIKSENIVKELQEYQ